MNVMIKDFELPNSCDGCPFCEYEQGECLANKGAYVPWEKRSKRQPWCPLEYVKPVVHGRWTKIRGVYDKRSIWYRCDRCGHSTEFLSNYCPDCGAEMDGDGE